VHRQTVGEVDAPAIEKVAAGRDSYEHRRRSFARPELAQKHLQTFEIGLISAQALFAPRRMGKSEFLEQDLIPAAQKSGLLTAYLNVWDAREHPGAP